MPMAWRLRDNLQRGFTWLVLAIALNTVDLMTTIYAVQHGRTEANPIVRPVVLSTAYIILKQVVVPGLAVVGSVCLGRALYRVAMKALVLMLGVVVLSNTCNLLFGWSPALDAVSTSWIRWDLMNIGIAAGAVMVAALQDHIAHTPPEKRLIALE